MIFQENSLTLCTAHCGIFYQLIIFSNEYILFGTLHCYVFLANTFTNTAEKTAIQIVPKGSSGLDCSLASTLIVDWVVLFFPHFWLTWWSLQWMCPNGEIPVNCQKFTRAFRRNLLSRNNCMELIQLSQKLGGNISLKTAFCSLTAETKKNNPFVFTVNAAGKGLA